MSSRWSARSGIALLMSGALMLGTLGTASAQDASDETGELTIWSYVQALEDTGLPPVFSEAFPNVKVNIVFVPFEQLPQKLLTAATTGTGPDIVQYNGANSVQLFNAGAIDDIDSYWQAFDDNGKWGTGSVSQADGKVIGAQSYVNLISLAYNKDILDELGIDVPTTIEEFDAALATVAENSDFIPLQIPGTPAIEGDWIAKPFFAGAGVDYSNLDSPEALAVYEMVENWVKNDYVNPDATSLSQTDGVPNFLAGETAFFITGNWLIERMRDGADFNLGFTQMPAGPEGSIVYLGGETVSLGAFSKNPDLAWEFMKLNWFSQQGQADILTGQGSIPVRADALELVSDIDPAIEVFSTQAAAGVPLPGGEIGPKESVAFGDIWNGLFAGQLDAAAAQKAAVERVQSLEAEKDQ